MNLNITLVDGLLYECYCQVRHYLSVCDCFHDVNIVPQAHEVLDIEDALELEKGLKPRGEIVNILFNRIMNINPISPTSAYKFSKLTSIHFLTELAGRI